VSQSNGSRLRVSGIVQGVGFRPFVWQLANDMALTGQVFNDAAGVTIDILANAATTERFVERLCNEHPPLAVIESVPRSLRASPNLVAFILLHHKPVR
tara:strand:+ start:302 stop:595 length:294 start_codon:yes stop_codon:yes gene_type:complete